MEIECRPLLPELSFKMPLALLFLARVVELVSASDIIPGSSASYRRVAGLPTRSLPWRRCLAPLEEARGGMLERALLIFLNLVLDVSTSDIIPGSSSKRPMPNRGWFVVLEYRSELDDLEEGLSG